MKRLMARAAALPPRTQDLALALVLVVVNVGSVLPYRSQMHPFWAALLLVIAQAVPLTWRRTWPFTVLILAGVPRILYDQLGFGYAPIPLASTIAFYTAMVHCRPAVRRLVIVLAVIGTTQSQVAPGHNQPYDAIVSVLTTLTAWLAAVLVRTRQAYVEEVESRAVRAETERDDEVARAAAAERTRIARELHDVVAHHVSLMAVQAEAATSLLPGRPAEAAQSVEVIAATARQALTELRRLLGVLRGPADQLETAPSASLADLGVLLDQVRGAGLAVDLTVQGTPGPLAPSVDLTAYRIIQEALTNTVRHANAAQAAVTLCYEPGFVTVSVTDSGRDRATVPVVNGTVNRAANGPATGRPANGSSGNASPVTGSPVTGSPVTWRPVTRRPVNGSPGPGTPVKGVSARGTPGAAPAGDQAEPVRSGGFGLAGIAERVASCGGSLSVGPTDAGGFAVTTRLPAR